MTQDSRNHAYIEKVRGLEQRFGSGDEALRIAVGGEFEAVGKLEYYLLRSLGLGEGDWSLMSAAAAVDWRTNWHHIRTSATSEQMSFPGWLRAPKP